MLGPQALYLLSHHLSSPEYWIFKTDNIDFLNYYNWDPNRREQCNELHLNNAVVWRVDINSGHVLKCPRWHVATCRRSWCQEAVLEMRGDITFISWHPPWEGPSKSSWKTHWSFRFGYLVVKSHYDHQQQFGNIISSHSCSRAVIWSHLLRCHGQSPGNGSCFRPSFYLTAACKNYKAVSWKNMDSLIGLCLTIGLLIFLFPVLAHMMRYSSLI